MDKNMAHPNFEEARSLIDRLEAAGWSAISVEDGVENIAVTSRDRLLRTILGVDECTLWVKKGKDEAWIFLVHGNSPGEMVCDFTYRSDLDKTISEHYADWE